MCVPVTRCHPGFRLRTTGATLPPSDHISVNGLQAGEQLTNTEEVVRLRIVWLHQYFVVFVFVSLSCLSCILNGQKVKRKNRETERDTRDTDYPSVHLLYLLIFIGKAEAFRGKVGREHIQPQLNVRKNQHLTQEEESETLNVTTIKACGHLNTTPTNDCERLAPK